ncbi:MAG: hypothetical protein HQL61_15340 [Magnetococcales bacterium]|nr:hypothetical protein [Nitrospirota bacterium]
MRLACNWMEDFIKMAVMVAAIAMLSGCGTSVSQIRQWEDSRQVSKLSEVARDKSESAFIRKKSLESLARLNWKPSNNERLQVYSMFASEGGYQEARRLMQTLTSEKFAEIDRKVTSLASLLDSRGNWSNQSEARNRYDELLSVNKKAVTISLCQQVVAQPTLQTRILLLAIKLGIDGSEEELVAVLFAYGDKSMAEDYLNSGSGKLNEGGRRWAAAQGYSVSTGDGSNRSGWGRF